MLWLFGQLWMWLLISCTLVAAAIAFFLAHLNRSPVDQATPPAFAEPTRYFQSPDYEDPVDDQPESFSPPRAPREWPPEPPETGRREGVLPPVERWPEQQGDESGAIEQPAWPKEDDSPSAGQWPGNRRPLTW